jgi:hypothetical protein
MTRNISEIGRSRIGCRTGVVTVPGDGPTPSTDFEESVDSFRTVVDVMIADVEGPQAVAKASPCTSGSSVGSNTLAAMLAKKSNEMTPPVLFTKRPIGLQQPPPMPTIPSSMSVDGRSSSVRHKSPARQVRIDDEIARCAP